MLKITVKLYLKFTKGKSGESYNIGTGININNIKLTKLLLNIVKTKI